MLGSELGSGWGILGAAVVLTVCDMYVLVGLVGCVEVGWMDEMAGHITSVSVMQ